MEILYICLGAFMAVVVFLLVDTRSIKRDAELWKELTETLKTIDKMSKHNQKEILGKSLNVFRPKYTNFFKSNNNAKT
jgi:hypothetical protein